LRPNRFSGAGRRLDRCRLEPEAAAVPSSVLLSNETVPPAATRFRLLGLRDHGRSAFVARGRIEHGVIIVAGVVVEAVVIARGGLLHRF
jgi:hypothetical protein